MSTQEGVVHLLPVCRLVAILDKADDCGVIGKFQDFNSRVPRGTVICINGEELGVNSPSFTCYSLLMRKLVIQLQMYVGTESWLNLQ